MVHHQNLIHYTSWEGFKGLFDSNSVWATHIRFLNDQSEYFYARNLMMNHFPEKVANWLKLESRATAGLSDKLTNRFGSFDGAVSHYTNLMIKSYYSTRRPDFFVASFCGEPLDDFTRENGLLSQWRGYGNGTGIAVYFNSAKLSTMFQSELDTHSYDASFLDDVTYDDDIERIKNQFLPKIQKVFDFTQLLPFSNGGEIPLDVAGDASESFIYVSTFFKHRGFKEEREYRLVASRIVHSDRYIELHKEKGSIPLPEKVVKFRTRNSKPVPYIELFGEKADLLPIERVLVGPGADSFQIADAISMMVERRQIPVSVSKIPYV
jgi:Protein of unknown function (DUF2971)